MRVGIYRDENGFGEIVDDLIARPFVSAARVRGQTIAFGGEVHFETTLRYFGTWPARPGFLLETYAGDEIARDNAFLEPESLKKARTLVSSSITYETKPRKVPDNRVSKRDKNISNIYNIKNVYTQIYRYIYLRLTVKWNFLISSLLFQQIV